MSDDHGPPGEAPQAHPRAEWSREPFVPVAAGNPDALRYAAVWGGVGVLVGVVVSTMWLGGLSAYRFGECFGIAVFPAVVVWLVARRRDKTWQWWHYPAWIALGSVIVLGGQALSGLQESRQLAARPHTAVVLPSEVLGARRLVPPALARQLKRANATARKNDLGGTIVAAEYTRPVAGREQVAFLVLGINNEPGGRMDKESTSAARALLDFVAGAKATGLVGVPAGQRGGEMKCGKITVAGNDLRTCFWVAFGREGAVVFVQDETSSPLADQTRKIRAAVEKHVKDD